MPKEKHLGGRPTKLTPKLLARLVNLLRAGNYRETAASAVGIDRHTIREWEKRGQRASPGDPKERVYREFAETVERSESEGECRHVTLIATAAQRQWTASAWLLERKHPEKWGRREAHQVTIEDKRPDLSKLSDKELDALHAINGKLDPAER